MMKLLPGVFLALSFLTFINHPSLTTGGMLLSACGVCAAVYYVKHPAVAVRHSTAAAQVSGRAVLKICRGILWVCIVTSVPVILWAIRRWVVPTCRHIVAKARAKFGRTKPETDEWL